MHNILTRGDIESLNQYNDVICMMKEMVNKIEKKPGHLLSIHVAELHKQGLIHHIHGTSASKKNNLITCIFS